MKWMHASLMLVSAAAAAMTVGCTPPPSAAAAVVNDKVYAVTPDTLKVKAGLVNGEVTGMKVTERVEEGSGRVATPAKLTGKLVLSNASTDKSVRLIGAKITYIDAQGQPIKLEDNRIEPTVKIAPSYGGSDRLDPGQEATHVLDAEFPVAALKANELKEIRIALVYTPSDYREETLSFGVSVGGK
jgi:hypothetical protein